MEEKLVFNQYPKVSVVIVSLNAKQTIIECLESIYNQSYPNLEIIIFDGCSTDGTIDILKEESPKIHFWKSEPDEGIYDAMNKATKVASGEWILFLGSDDKLLTGFSDMCYELKKPSSIYYGSVLYKGRKCNGYVNQYNFAKLGLHHQAVFYHKIIFEKYNYNTNYRIAADYVLNITCFKDADIEIIFKDHIVANYNHTGISATKEDDLLKQNKSSLIRTHFGLLIWIRYMIKVIKKNYGGETLK